MGLVDIILNLAALLLWLNWRSIRFDPLIRRMPATLMGTLRPAAPKRMRRWRLLGFIVLLLSARAVTYWWIGSGSNWSASLNLGVVVLWFSSGPHWAGFCHMLLFSFASFGLLLGVFYVWLIALSLLAGPLPMHLLVAIPLGRVDGWPRWVKALLPFVVTAFAWCLASWLFIRLNILTPIRPAGCFEQSLILGASSYLLWKFPLGLILLLNLANSYIYFGRHPLWKYVSETARAILRPLQRIHLRLGKVDFAPLAGIALLFLAAHFAEMGLSALYNRLPFFN